jgi:hypothetical protein
MDKFKMAAMFICKSIEILGFESIFFLIFPKLQKIRLIILCFEVFDYIDFEFYKIKQYYIFKIERLRINWNSETLEKTKKP